MTNGLINIVIASLSIACVAWTVTKEEIFREWREYCVKRKSCANARLVARKFFYVFTCEYCFSHWVAAVFVAVTRIKLVAEGFAGYVVAFFATVAVTNIYLSGYTLFRIVCRWARAKADKAEAELKQLTASGS